jgi:hypothetical protein
LILHHVYEVRPRKDKRGVDLNLVSQQAETNCPFQFQKRSRLCVGVNNEPLTVVAMRVSNEHRSSVGIDSCDTTPTPSGFAEIVGDDFQVPHAGGFCRFCSPHGNAKVRLLALANLQCFPTSFPLWRQT